MVRQQWECAHKITQDVVDLLFTYYILAKEDLLVRVQHKIKSSALLRKCKVCCSRAEIFKKALSKTMTVATVS